MSNLEPSDGNNDLPSEEKMTSGNDWATRVEQYVEHLDEVAETIDLILDETRVSVLGVKDQQIHESTLQLQTALEELEEMVAGRDQLIRDPDAPTEGDTLEEKLKSTFRIEDARLAKRCHEVSEKIQTTHQRALSLFVCQYHLSDLTGDLLQTLSGSKWTATYKSDGGGQHQKPTGQGGLFDEAA